MIENPSGAPSQAAQSHALPPLSLLCEAAREAGDIALRYFGNSPKTWMKQGNSPVTEADLAIDTMLHKELRAAYPAFGWLSEEIENDGSHLSGAPTFIVDPIDGTRGFMAASNDWCVSLALVYNGAPQQGVLFNPVLGELMFAEADQGARMELASGEIKTLTPTGKDDLGDALIVYPGPQKPNQPFRKAPRIASLALRIGRVAEGKLDGCVAGPNAKHWDIAAADLIVREAGLHLLDTQGKAARYDEPSIKHGALVCGTQALCDTMLKLVP